MQHAAEEGARAALRYQSSRDLRLTQAQSVVRDRMSWLPANLQPTQLQARVCRLANPAQCAPALVCTTELDQRCIVEVSFEVPYGSHPLAPPLPGFGILLPQSLKASATVLVDQGGL